MGKQRLLLRIWALVATAALLAPAAAQAQVFFGVPAFGRPPVTLYGPIGGGSYFPGYYGGSPYSGYGYPYSGYPYGYGGLPYSMMQTSQPLALYSQSYAVAGGLPFTGLPSVGVTASTYPRMRSTYYPPGTAYTGTGVSALDAGSLTGSAALRPANYAGTYSVPGQPATTAAPGGCMPVAYASMVCGSLNYAPVAYDPAGYAATAAAVFSPPPRARDANYPPNSAISPAALASYGQGLAPRRAEVDLRLPTAAAEVWFDGVKMKVNGTRRHFFTPRLEPGGRYTYEVRARWQEKGRTREQTRPIYLRPGDVTEVDFTHGGDKQ